MKKTRRSGFTLIELLTVIAIIAILAAIIFPVMSTVKERARQNQCMTNLHQIGIAVQAYKTDNRKYPLVLGSEAAAGKQFGDDDGYLFKEYVKTVNMFHCPSAKTTNSTDTIAFDVTSADTSNPIKVFAYDSYDAFVTNMSGAPAYSESANNAERRYYTDWGPGTDPSVVGATSLKPYPPSTADSPLLMEQDFARQLRFRNPPGDTVVTWCSYHEGADQRGKSLVLFLDGSVDMMPANEMVQCKWRIRPKRS